jgi:hypothetical protein
LGHIWGCLPGEERMVGGVSYYFEHHCYCCIATQASLVKTNSVSSEDLHLKIIGDISNLMFGRIMESYGLGIPLDNGSIIIIIWLLSENAAKCTLHLIHKVNNASTGRLGRYKTWKEHEL